MSTYSCGIEGRLLGKHKYDQCAVAELADNAVAVCCGDLHTAVVLADGSVICRGINAYNECRVPAGVIVAPCRNILM
jgi:alpha-tubulin suppressor-like RCC1 family protein